MKKVLIIFLVLLTVFAGVWTFKSKTPTSRPDSYANGLVDQEGMWWNVAVDISGVDEQWILDPEIPDNYLPVPGEDELYMVVDENGYITGYRHRTKQEDGSWVWEDVNPDIPDNYEAVEGLEDVYKVTYSDGSVKYFKYIRNDDDTYAFVEVDEKGNLIDNAAPTGNDIPANYVHLGSNVYAVLNEHGVVVGYKKRVLNEDGTYTWVDAQKPKKGDSSDSGPILSYNSGGNNTAIPGAPDSNGANQPVTPGSSVYAPGQVINPVGEVVNGGGTETTKNADGSYTETESFTTTETKGGWVITYKTTVVRTYDASGTLLSTKKDGPTEISKTQVTDSGNNTPDKSKVASTIDAEVARMSAGISFNGDLANQVLAQLNAQRAAAGKAPLSMDGGSTAYKVAQARAAAMATYDYSDYNSPLYGSLANMVSQFGISSNSPSENAWRTTPGKSADAINVKLSDMSGARMGDYTSIGIAIVEKNGYMYISEILL